MEWVAGSDIDDLYAEVFGRWNDFGLGLSINQTPLKSIYHINTGYIIGLIKQGMTLIYAKTWLINIFTMPHFNRIQPY